MRLISFWGGVALLFASGAFPSHAMTKREESFQSSGEARAFSPIAPADAPSSKDEAGVRQSSGQQSAGVSSESSSPMSTVESEWDELSSVDHSGMASVDGTSESSEASPCVTPQHGRYFFFPYNELRAFFWEVGHGFRCSLAVYLVPRSEYGNAVVGAAACAILWDAYGLYQNTGNFWSKLVPFSIGMGAGTAVSTVLGSAPKFPGFCAAMQLPRVVDLFALSLKTFFMG